MEVLVSRPISQHALLHSATDGVQHGVLGGMISTGAGGVHVSAVDELSERAGAALSYPF